MFLISRQWIFIVFLWRILLIAYLIWIRIKVKNGKSDWLGQSDRNSVRIPLLEPDLLS